MGRIMLYNDDFGSAMGDNLPSLDIAPLFRPSGRFISGVAHRDQHAEVSAFDYKVLKEWEKVYGHLRNSLVDQERQRLAV